ncbi:MAG: hypothetical protein ACR2NR_07695 [Solirubrobacteraceae bacterium]
MHQTRSNARKLLDALDARSADAGLILEQDTAIAAPEPAANHGPMRDRAHSIALVNAAPTEEINR